MRILVSLITLWALVFSTGCQATSIDAEEPSNPAFPPLSTTVPGSSSEEGDSTQMTPSLSISADAGFQDLIEKAKEDLAQRLSISVVEINLVEAKAVVWPDSSMGCPQPGMAYLQVPEDGALIVLQVEGNVYEYHNGGNRGLFLCEMIYKDPNPPPKIDFFNLTPSKPITPSTPDNSIPPGGDN